MSAENSSVDRIVDELLARPHDKQEKIELLRELVRRGEDLPDEMLEQALQRLMRRLTE